MASRTVHDLGDPLSGRPIDLHICYSTHRCLACRCSFPADQSDLAPLKSQYTHRVQQTAVRLVIEDDIPSRLKVYKAVFEPKVTQDASEMGVGVVFVS